MARRIASERYLDLPDLLDFVRRRHHMILATRRSDGTTQMSPVTGGLDEDGRIVIATYASRAKARNVRRNPDVSVCVLSDDFTGAWVQIDGTAELLAMPDAEQALVDYYRSVSGEHPDWDDYRKAMRVQEKNLLRITPIRWGPVATRGFPADVAARLDAEDS